MSDNIRENSIVEKTTIVKSAEPFAISCRAFAGGHKVEFKYQFDPNNPIVLDQLEMELAKSDVKRAIHAVHKLIEAPISEGGLESHVLTEADIASKALSKKGSSK